MIKDTDTLTVLLEVSRTIASTLDLDKVDELILREATRVFNTDHGSLFLLDEKTNRLILTAARGFSEDELENLNILGSWEEINQEVVNRKEPLVVNEVAKDPMLKDRNLPLRSFISVPLKAEEKIVGILNLSNRRGGVFFDVEAQRLILILANHAAIAVLNAKLYRETEELFISIVSSLAAAIDAKDHYTAGHSERVTRFAQAIGEEMGLSSNSLKNLKLTSLLHDVGKIGVKESVLLKPGRLDEDEIRQIREHPAIGTKIVGSILHSEKLLPGVVDHHERYNGRGYPKGLKDNEISLEGRIIAVADVFDALTSDRSYRKAWTREAAVEEIKKNSGMDFDPDTVEAFLHALEKGKI